MQAQPPSMLKPALVSGTVFGVVAAIPVVNWVNCACCALIIGSGFLAAYLLSQQHKAADVAFTPSTGAQVGLMSGLVYGVVTSIVSTILSFVFGFGDFDKMLEQMREMGTVNPETMQQITHFMQSTGPTVILLFGVFMSLLLGAIFATLGGLIGGSLFRVTPAQPPEGSPELPPPPPPVGPGA